MKLKNLLALLKLLFKMIHNIIMEFALRANNTLASSVDPLDYTNDTAA